MTADDLLALIAVAPLYQLIFALTDAADTIAAQRGGDEGQSGWI